MTNFPVRGARLVRRDDGAYRAYVRSGLTLPSPIVDNPVTCSGGFDDSVRVDRRRVRTRIRPVISLTRRSESPVAEPPVVEEIEGAVTPATVTFELALGLRDQPLVIPPDNPMSPEKIALGERLFFDTRLSGANEMSCETCPCSREGLG